ncbi:MAG: site-specific integrase [Rubrivivax sp.]|nr:site-specific integrase [Rubrivivax sp.]
MDDLATLEVEGSPADIRGFWGLLLMSSATRSLGWLCEEYLRFKVLAPESCKRYRLSATNLARQMHGAKADPTSVPLQSITADVLIAFRDDCRRRMRPASVNTERRHLSTMLNFACRQGCLERNPYREVPSIPTPQTEPKALAKKEMFQFLEFLESGRRLDSRGRSVDVIPPQWFWLAVLRTFYFTGMRKRQLLGLHWNDISLTEETILLRSDTSKTRREWRVPLPPALAPDLMNLMRETQRIVGNDLDGRQVFCLPLFSAWSGAFVSREMRAHNLDGFFRRLRKHLPASMPRISAHRIRHTTATILANAVPNLKVVQQQLGHTSISTTYGYVHPDLNAMRDALGAL